MSIKLLETTPKQDRHYFIALVIGGITGIISAFVKSGTEDILPPRIPDRIAPPAQMLTDMGIDWHSLVYSYSDQLVYWGGNLYILFFLLPRLFFIAQLPKYFLELRCFKVLFLVFFLLLSVTGLCFRYLGYHQRLFICQQTKSYLRS